MITIVSEPIAASLRRGALGCRSARLMINLRYHIVCIMAVFLALGIGS